MGDIKEMIERATGLIGVIGNINSFEAVGSWDSEAQRLVEALKGGIADIESDVVAINSKADQEHVAFKTQSFFKRLGNSNPSKKTRGAVQILQRQMTQATTSLENLEEWIDRTPDDLAEAKSMIADYKLLKKELALAKKGATQAMRDAREASRARNANLTFATGKAGKFARDVERLRKERGLAKHQNERDNVEVQILAVDRRIMWLERIAKG